MQEKQEIKKKYTRNIQEIQEIQEIQDVKHINSNLNCISLQRSKQKAINLPIDCV